MPLVFRLAVTAALLTMLAPAERAVAQSAQPPRQIKIVVPFPPGGTADILTRILGEQIAKTGGPTTLVENRPGEIGRAHV